MKTQSNGKGKLILPFKEALRPISLYIRIHVYFHTLWRSIKAVPTGYAVVMVPNKESPNPGSGTVFKGFASRKQVKNLPLEKDLLGDK